jgi:Ca2+-binding RTX toxin-like protein
MAKSKFTSGNDSVALSGKRGELANALAGDDTVTGTAAGDTISGGEGNDNLAGLAGDDRLFGDAGDDLLSGGSGNNVLQGGNGVDTVSYAAYGTSQPLYVNLALGFAVDQVGLNGADPVSGSGQTLNDLITGVENVIGAPDTSNKLVGDVNANRLAGGNVGDELMGGLGADSLVGLGGNDTLQGGAGIDAMEGGVGDDWFVFGAGDAPGFFSNSVPQVEFFDFYSVEHVYNFETGVDFTDGDRIIIAYEEGNIAVASYRYDEIDNETFLIYTTDAAAPTPEYYAVLIHGELVSGSVGFLVVS